MALKRLWLLFVKIIVSKVASTPDEVAMYAECTLLAASLAASHEGSSNKLGAVKACVEYLQENEFIARTSVTDSSKIMLCLTYLCLCSTPNACFYAYFCKVFLQSFGFYDTIILLVS